MKRSCLFLQYILKQEKSSMMYQVLKATLENPLKNDFVTTCQKNLNVLGISLSFQEIENMLEMQEYFSYGYFNKFKLRA